MSEKKSASKKKHPLRRQTREKGVSPGITEFRSDWQDILAEIRREGRVLAIRRW